LVRVARADVASLNREQKKQGRGEGGRGPVVAVARNRDGKPLTGVEIDSSEPHVLARSFDVVDGYGDGFKAAV
jgi:hypothetical protein